MRNKLTYLLCFAGMLAGTQSLAQDNISAPLSVIDWLDTQPQSPPATPAVSKPPAPKPVVRIEEPEVADSVTVPEVTVQPLGQNAAKRVGLAPASVTGLPDALWSSDSGQVLVRKFKALPELRLPALQSLYYTLLLAETLPPATDSDAFDLARVDALFDLGALDPAKALLEQAGPDTSPAHFARFMDMSLLARSEANACAILQARPKLSPGKAHEVFCAARAGDWDTAVLQLGTGRVLGLIDALTTQALERFLDPDLFEEEPPLPSPRMRNPLMFRLFEAIGTPIPTRSWPVVYANADLSDTAGWKAQIEASERLARTGAVPDNRLLGLYTQRRPAASGSVWDRVAALQRFETALGTGSASAVSKTLPTAWSAMGDARLRVHFANLFAEDLSAMTLSGTTADIAFEVLLLSPDYETAATTFPVRALRRPALAAIAAGNVPDSVQADGTADAILSAFRDAPADDSIVTQAQSGHLGVALLDTLALTVEGAQGDIARLTTGLATLRALGLEDVARRTALQTLLLESSR